MMPGLARCAAGYRPDERQSAVRCRPRVPNMFARMLMLLATPLLTQLKPVKRAATAAEREAVYRFRYRIYVDELGREIGGVDHAGRRVCDDEDERPHSHHFYVGTPERIEGIVRLRVWEPGAMPAPRRAAARCLRCARAYRRR